MNAHLRERLRAADPAARLADYDDERCRAIVSRIVETDHAETTGDRAGAATPAAGPHRRRAR